jgi:hypothetical protein
MAIPILVKELKTGKVYHAASVQDAAKYTGVSATTIYQGFYGGLKNVRCGEYTFCEDYTNEVNRTAINSKPVIRTNTLTGEEVRFRSVKEAAEATFVSESTVREHLKGIERRSNIAYTWRWAEKEQGVG